MTIKTLPSPQMDSTAPSLPSGLLEDLRHMIDQARQSIASTVNASLTIL